jgi:site-specific DNA recombinase
MQTKTKTDTKAVAYIRVSTDGQAADGISLDAQAAKIEAYCALNDLPLLETYTDAGISAKRADNRPALQDALQAIREGRANALVVYKLDRLARCTIDALEIAQQLDRHGASLHSLNEKLDTGSAMGRFFFTLVASLAEMERGIIAERTAAAHAHKRSKGQATGHAPFGWQLAKDGSTLEPVPTEQETLGLIQAMKAEGKSLRIIAETLNNQGRKTKQGQPWKRSNLRSVLATHQRRQSA